MQIYREEMFLAGKPHPFVLAFRQRYTGATQTVRRRILSVSYRNNKLRG
jgi:hypothetical protein